MIWWLVVLGVFVLIGALMYVPDWIRWARWNAKRKRLPENRASKMRAPVAAPFWSAYAGDAYAGGASSGSDCGPGGFDGGGAIFGGSGGGDGGSGCD